MTFTRKDMENNNQTNKCPKCSTPLTTINKTYTHRETGSINGYSVLRCPQCQHEQPNNIHFNVR